MAERASRPLSAVPHPGRTWKLHNPHLHRGSWSASLRIEERLNPQKAGVFGTVWRSDVVKTMRVPVLVWQESIEQAKTCLAMLLWIKLWARRLQMPELEPWGTREKRE